MKYNLFLILKIPFNNKLEMEFLRVIVNNLNDSNELEEKLFGNGNQ